MVIPTSYFTLSYKTKWSLCCVVGGVAFASFICPCLSQFSRCRDFVFLCDCWKTLFLFGSFGLWYYWLFLVLRKVRIYKSALICKTSHQRSISCCNVWNATSRYSHRLMHTMRSSQTIVGVSRIVVFASCRVSKKNKTNSELTCYCNLWIHLWSCVCVLPTVFCLSSACLHIERVWQWVLLNSL